MNRCMTINLEYFYGTYAVVLETDDYSYNNDQCTLILFKDHIDYDEHIKAWKEEQPYTGKTWTTLYIRENYNKPQS